MNMRDGKSRIPPGVWLEVAGVIQDREREVQALPALKVAALELASRTSSPPTERSMAPKREPLFGLNCGVFNVELSGTDIVLPRAKTSPIVRSMLPHVVFPNNAGAFMFWATHAGKVICDVPVIASWENDPRERFLALRTSDAPAIVDSLKPYAGKPVELSFTEMVPK